MRDDVYCHLLSIGVRFTQHVLQMGHHHEHMRQAVPVSLQHIEPMRGRSGVQLVQRRLQGSMLPPDLGQHLPGRFGMYVPVVDGTVPKGLLDFVGEGVLCERLVRPVGQRDMREPMLDPVHECRNLRRRYQLHVGLRNSFMHTILQCHFPAPVCSDNGIVVNDMHSAGHVPLQLLCPFGPAAMLPAMQLCLRIRLILQLRSNVLVGLAQQCMQRGLLDLLGPRPMPHGDDVPMGHDERSVPAHVLLPILRSNAMHERQRLHVAQRDRMRSILFEALHDSDTLLQRQAVHVERR